MRQETAVPRNSSVAMGNSTTLGMSTAPRAGSVRYLATDQVIVSPQSQARYVVGRFLGEGGFGQVYLARRPATVVVGHTTLCIKVSRHLDGWLREAYFGQVLDRHPRTIRVFDTFRCGIGTGRSSTAWRWSTRRTAT
jgi:serine/threonine protein kinase